MAPFTRHRLWQLATDAGLIVAAWYLAFRLRFDHEIPIYYRTLFDRTVFAVLGIQLVVFVAFGFYNRFWRYVSTRDMWGAARGVTVACLISSLTIYFWAPVPQLRMPRSVAIIDWLLLLAFVAGARLLARTVMERPSPRDIVARGKEVVVVGAGDAAQLVVRELLRSPALGYTPIGLIDDDAGKRNMRLHGVRVLGGTGDLRRIIREQKPDEVLIAVPSASGELRQRVVMLAREEGVPVKTLPGLHELFAGDSNLAAQIRPVQVEDVLGREPVEVDLREAGAYLRDETVLVTGAGGSIGSELCRQIVQTGCRRLILVDQAETPLFEIERELVAERDFPAAVPILADVGNRAKMTQVLAQHRPGVVFHAAAYKHVPLMESNPLESVRNNALATRTVADVAVELGVKRFVLVSTDKAVNPQTVMGQSKALCEWIVESLGSRPDVETRFVGVRFGNVLGSSGSVIPIFRRQIERGGPVTVTDPEMTRFFMTIPEAVSLVVQAGAIGGRGDLFVLDMGDPVRIVDLARDMILLSGKEPDRDVAIEFVGARAGEKLHEELWSDEETVSETPHPKIRLVTGRIVDPLWLEEELTELERLVEEGDRLGVVTRLAAMIRKPKFVGGPAGSPYEPPSLESHALPAS
jgi:FlaA1/EpsC-like NDP-sugar epimerase